MSGELSHRRWRKLRDAVLAASDICWLCGQPGADTVDHVVERSKGGSVMDPSNLRPAHGSRIERTADHPGCPGNFGRSAGQGFQTSRDW